jgi:D-alanine transaminase
MDPAVETVYLNGDYVRREEAAVPVLDRGFMFADGVYEVIRSYRGRLFEQAAHMERLRRSLREIRMAQSASAGLEKVFPQLLERNGLAGSEALVYVQITRGVAPRAHQFPVPEKPPTVYAHVAQFEPPFEQRDKGIPVILVPDTRWSRCDIKSIALLPNILARQMAEDTGAEEAIFIRDGIVTEGSASTFCAVFSGTVVTHPDSNVVLPGITKRVVFDLCRRTGIPAAERPIREDELSRAAEILVLSTSREVMPVISLDGMKVGDGRPGQLTRKIQAAFSEVIR